MEERGAAFTNHTSGSLSSTLNAPLEHFQVLCVESAPATNVRDSGCIHGRYRGVFRENLALHVSRYLDAHCACKIVFFPMF
jgi:hypothetical protein